MDYQAYRVQSFDEDGSTSEGQMRIHKDASEFDTAQVPGVGEKGADFEQATPREEGPSPGTDFASIKFQRENTLLTNAERYADSIREEAELYVRQLQAEIEALNQQADKRYEEARLVKEESEAEAERRLEEADRRVEEVRQQAHREGYEMGREEGMRKRYEEAGADLANIETILADLSQFREQVTYLMEKDGIRLAVLMAKKILQQELKTNKNVIWKQLAAVLSHLEGTGNFRIWLNPGDFRFAMAARPTLEKFVDEDQTLSFRPRDDLPPGNALIETDREVIDLTMASQFRHLEESLYQHLAEREAAVMNRPPEVLASQGDPVDAAIHPNEEEAQPPDTEPMPADGQAQTMDPSPNSDAEPQAVDSTAGQEQPANITDGAVESSATPEPSSPSEDDGKHD